MVYLDNDIVRVTYDHVHGLSGYINDIDIIEVQLFVSTGAGLYRSREGKSLSATDGYFYSKSGEKPEFELVSTRPIVWSTEALGRDIFIATEEGVFWAKKDEMPLAGYSKCTVLDGAGGHLPLQAFTLYANEEKSKLLVGFNNGLGVLDWSGSSCTIRIIELGIEDVEVRTIVEYESILWLGTAIHGFLAIRDWDSQHAKKSVLRSNGHFPGRNDVIRWGDRLFGYNASGIVDLSIDSARVFLSDINGPLSELSNISVMRYLDDGQGWVVTQDSVVQVQLRFGQLEVVRSPASLEFTKSSTSTATVDHSGVLWFNNGSELVRYDPKYDVPDNKVLAAQVSSVNHVTTGEWIFRGFFSDPDGWLVTTQPEWAIPRFKYDERAIALHFSATEYTNPEKLQYRYRIYSSPETDWSPWSTSDEYLFSTLAEGTYVVLIQAKDEIGRESSIASYSFVILPPWYRTYWAYLAYLVFGVAALISAKKYLMMRRAHKLAAEQAKELEREREVVKKLSEANDRLTQANKLKDEFLATTSHELRTPLTAILGFTSVLKDEIPEDAEYREFLDIIEDSGSRLVDTLNSLLDLAKLRAGIMDINLEALDLYQAVFQEVVPHQEAATKKGLKLKVRRPDKQLYALADMHGLGRIVHNLVGNAVKFTEEGGVEVWFAETAHGIEMHVTDTGIGIDEQFLPDLFDAFIQESDGLSRTYEGTGLGLAITSGIVQLMDGTIMVESRKGEGSDFVVVFQKADGPRRQARKMPGFGNRASA